MNKSTKYAGILAGLSGLAMALPVGAQTYSYTSQIATTTQIARDLTSDALLTFVVVAGLVLAVGLLSIGVAFVWKQIQKRALGRKL